MYNFVDFIMDSWKGGKANVIKEKCLKTTTTSLPESFVPADQPQ